jgi:general secretion pathway protein B
MSFILDALKKSETERLRKNSPGIANIAESGRQKSSQKWMWLVLVLLAINLVAVAGLIFVGRPKPAVIQAPVATSEPAASEMPAPSSVSTAIIERKPPLVTVIEPEVVAAEARAEPPAESNRRMATSAPTGSVYDGLESFNELRAKGRLSLPDLHLDIHVYGERAADRFVFVNMSKYREGASLSEGPTVREITPDGVILDYQGTAFLLPRE